MSDRLSEIEERLADATPGPWEVEEKFSLTSIRMQDPTARLGFRLVAQVPRRIVGENADAELIANAPADLAALVKFAREVKALAEGLEDQPPFGASTEEQHQMDAEKSVARRLRTALDRVGGA